MIGAANQDSRFSKRSLASYRASVSPLPYLILFFGASVAVAPSAIAQTSGSGGSGGAVYAYPSGELVLMGGEGGAPGADGGDGDAVVEFPDFAASGGGGGGSDALGGAGGAVVGYGSGGAGGNGGASGVIVGGSYLVDAPVIGGDGENGGAGFLEPGEWGVAGGGGGGAGGAGLYVSGPGVITVTNSGTVIGGDGGNGGPSVLVNPTSYSVGSGVFGVGGAGVYFASPSNNILNNYGTIVGGDSGTGGSIQHPDGSVTIFLGGAAGAGVSGTGVVINNHGTIVGGGGPTGQAGAGIEGNSLTIFNSDSGLIAGYGDGYGGWFGVYGSDISIVNDGLIYGGISFQAGSNSLELHAHSEIIGDVIGTGSDLFRLGGSVNATFDVSHFGSQYTGFSSFEKTGSSTWTLTGTTTALTPWTISQGVLNVSQDGSLGAANGGLSFNGGTLQYGASFDLASTRAITLYSGGGTFDTNGYSGAVDSNIGGAGGLTKVGLGTLTLNGINSYSGGTNVNEGELAVGGSLGTGIFPGGAIVVGSSGTLHVLSEGSINIGENDLTNFGNLLVDAGGAVHDDLINFANVTNHGAYFADVQNSNPGVIYNDGATATWNGAVKSNTGLISNQNGASWTGNVISNSGTVLNQSGASWSGDVLANVGAIYNNALWNGQITNNVGGQFINDILGTLTNGLQNEGVASNYGVINGGVVNSGSFETTNTVNGGLRNNSGSVFARGAVNGAIENNGSGYFELTGNLSNDGSLFNDVGATLQLHSNTLTTPFLDNYGFALAQRATLIGDLSNSGTIDLTQGIDPTNNFLAIDGNYNGAGSLRVVSNIGVSSGQLLVSGSANGTTAVYVQPTSGTGMIAPPTLVARSASSSGGAFYLANAGQLNSGFATYSIRNSGSDYYITSDLNPSIVVGSGSNVRPFADNFVTMQSSFFLDGSDFVDFLERSTNAKDSPYVTSKKREPNTLVNGLWIRGATGYNTVSGTATAWVNQGPLSHTNAAATRTKYLFDGYQGGYDIGLLNINDTGINAHVGVTAGQYFSRGYGGASSYTSFNVPFVGIYGVANGNGFFGDFVVRHDFWNANATDYQAFLYGRSYRASGWTGSASGGYNYKLDETFFVEPSAAIHVTSVGVSNLHYSTHDFASWMSFSTVHSTLGRLGARFGGVFAVDQFVLSPFMTGSAWHDFAGNSYAALNMVSIFNASQVPITTTGIGTFAQLGAGLSGSLRDTGLSFFARGDYRIGGNIEGANFTGGVRYNF